ncbi:recombination protein NinG [Parahaliea mediterranea]|uniref:recombination protein NinG n=1 Tax=Parahaliea mediterranea TaxID=651086 RepID=UPI000E2F9BCC|nr:recombination protein NinG [Parahaliea mediterranea]
MTAPRHVSQILPGVVEQIAAPGSGRKLKARNCKACGETFDPSNGDQVVCGSVACALQYARHKRWSDEAQAYRAKQAAKNTASRSTGPGHQASQAVNAFVLARDHDKPCIVHGASCPNREFDAGHFQGADEAPELRYNTWNIHKQCRKSNRGAHHRKKFRSTTPAKFEAGLVARIGQDRVDWLKGPHGAKDYSEAELRRMASIFRRREALYRRLRESRSNQIGLLEG